jgi:hypothetical protein
MTLGGVARPPKLPKLAKVGVIPILLGLDGETEGDFARAVKKLKHMVANQAAKLALLSWSRRQFDPAIAGAALGTGDVGLSHGQNL